MLVVKSNKPSTSQVTVVSTRKNKGGKRRRKSKALIAVMPSSSSTSVVSRRFNPKSNRNSVFRSWVDTLNDPFFYPPIPYGFGTFQPTQLATAYYHGSVAANSVDGTFMVAIGTSLIGGINYSNSALSSGVWTSASYQNTTALQALGDNYRVISLGVRACPLVAATSVPGVSYTGLVDENINNLTTTGNLSTASALSSYVNSHIGLATYGSTAISRPIDDTVAEFLLQTRSTTIASISGWATPYIVFTNLPVSSTVIFEVVMNIEILGGNSAVANGTEVANLSGGLVSAFPTFNAAYRAAIPLLGPSIKLDFDSGGPAGSTVLSQISSSRMRRNISRVVAGAGMGNRMSSFAEEHTIDQLNHGTTHIPTGTAFERPLDEEPVHVTPGLSDADRSSMWENILSHLGSVGIPVAGLTAGVLSTAAGRRALYNAIDRGAEHLPI